MACITADSGTRMETFFIRSNYKPKIRKRFVAINPLTCLICHLTFKNINLNFVLIIAVSKKMKKINSYLSFNGNCKEAMQYYQQVLGGLLTLQTIGDSPLSEKMEPEMRSKIVHAALKGNDFIIFGSDLVDDTGLINGNTVSILINFTSEKEIKDVFNQLSQEGVTNQPLQLSFWGALFGSLTDKYGSNWLLHFDNRS